MTCRPMGSLPHAKVSDAERITPSEPRCLNLSCVFDVHSTTRSPLCCGSTEVSPNRGTVPHVPGLPVAEQTQAAVPYCVGFCGQIHSPRACDPLVGRTRRIPKIRLVTSGLSVASPMAMSVNPRMCGTGAERPKVVGVLIVLTSQNRAWPGNS